MRPADVDAGTAPITKASGKGRAVLMRRVGNTRLFETCRDWSFSAVNPSPGARALSQHRRGLGDGHERALRRVGHKLVGQLDHCLRHHERHREETAWTLTAEPSRRSDSGQPRVAAVGSRAAEGRREASRSALEAAAKTRTMTGLGPAEPGPPSPPLVTTQPWGSGRVERRPYDDQIGG